jgi:hypothetical protein
VEVETTRHAIAKSTEHTTLPSKGEARYFPKKQEYPHSTVVFCFVGKARLDTITPLQLAINNVHVRYVSHSYIPFILTGAQKIHTKLCYKHRAMPC